MNNDYFGLKFIPQRTIKPRTNGITMVMDKGLSPRQVEDFIEIGGPHVDIVKIGFGTSMVTPNLKTKLDIYKNAGIPFYFGGTLFEAFLIREQLREYRKFLEKYEVEYMEISDGCLEIPHQKKCALIRLFSRDFKVLSEVGSKDSEKIIAPYRWINMMEAEIKAGSWKLIAEARESGSVGIYRASGEVRMGLVEEILTKIPPEKVIWEAPKKVQQDWFIKLLGQNVNLGNIAPNEIIPLETLRVGLRGDTFHQFLEEGIE